MGYFWNTRLSYEDSLQFSFIYIVTNHNRSLYLGKVKTLEYYRKPEKPQQSVAPLLASILVTVGRKNNLLKGRNLEQNKFRLQEEEGTKTHCGRQPEIINCREV